MAIQPPIHQDRKFVALGLKGLFCLVGLLFTVRLQAQVIPADSLYAGPKGTGKSAIKKEMDASDSTKVIISPGADPIIAELPEDSVKAKKARKPSHAIKLHLSPKKDFYDPRVAVRRSAVLPGWGQVYNNRIWKVPIIYGGMGTFIAFIIGNNQGYREYDLAVKCKGDTANCALDPFPGRSLNNVLSIREDYRRARDFNVILCGLWYALNLVDAYVDAHLRGFNVSDDLSMDVNPSLGFDPFQRKRMYVGATLTLSLRK